MISERRTFMLPCRASNLRGQLKHTYLTNKVCLNTLPEDLLESMLEHERGVPQHQVIREKIAELLDALESRENGFSPAQLVDQLNVFRQMPTAEREAMKQRIHQQFAAAFRLTERKSRLAKKAQEFLATLDSFLSQGKAAAAVAKASMGRVQETAAALILELEGLPKGIWLWETPRRETIAA